ncbi:MAG: hypothetical protein IPM71_15665 [Bacteroidota bacterium]|nr:MAG: hypothetical protein IPM71_15665 [Bacteroidota bacterium]
MNEMIKCPTCKTEYEQQPDNCGNCGYPFSGTDKEKSHFVAHQILKKGKISDTKENIRNARIILFVIAAFNILLPILKYSEVTNGGVQIGIGIFIGFIFLFFGIIAKKKPFISILIPLILLIIFYALIAIIQPISLVQGVVWKVIFITGLVYSLITIKESDKIKKESSHLSKIDYK